jgi:hypothetical protein
MGDVIRKRISDLCVCLFLLVLGLSVLPGGCGDGGDSSEPTVHAKGDLWANVYPTIIAAYQADHTYLQALTTDDATLRWGCFGKSTDGEYLSRTRTNSTVDLTVADFMASQEPCIWPLALYAQVGVCHQCANRGLYHTGRTVSEAAGYTFFAAIYGTYGYTGFPYEDYDLKRCLEKAPALQQAVAEEKAAGKGFDEQALYASWFGKSENKEAHGSDPDERWTGYLNDLFEGLVGQRLGDGQKSSLTYALLEAQNTMLARKRELDKCLRKGSIGNEEYHRLLQEIMSDFSDRAAAVLGPWQYERLFNLEYKKDRDFMVLWL